MLIEDPTHQGPTRSDPLALVCFIVWSFALGLSAGVGVLMAIVWIVTPTGIAVAAACALLAALCVLASVRLAFRWPRGPALARWAAVGGLIASQAPTLVRVALPWEDPVDGSGSPLAVLIGISFFGGLLGLALTLPGFILTIWLWSAVRRRSKHSALAVERLARHGADS